MALFFYDRHSTDSVIHELQDAIIDLQNDNQNNAKYRIKKILQVFPEDD